MSGISSAAFMTAMLGSAAIGAGGAMGAAAIGRKKYKPSWQIIEDPYKKGTASQLSRYLGEYELGKGLPRYTGALYEPFTPEAESRYSEFLSMKPEEFFQTKIAEPQIKEWKEDVLPEIEEKWAGARYGSGVARDIGESISGLSEELANVGAQYVPGMYAQQFATAKEYSEAKTEQKKLEYMDWYKSLPEYNPMIEYMLKFLAGETGWNAIWG